MSVDLADAQQAQDGVGYAVFARVVEGMDVVKELEGVKTESRGMHRDVPSEPIVITKVTIILAGEAPKPAADQGE